MYLYSTGPLFPFLPHMVFNSNHEVDEWEPQKLQRFSVFITLCTELPVLVPTTRSKNGKKKRKKKKTFPDGQICWDSLKNCLFSLQHFYYTIYRFWCYIFEMKQNKTKKKKMLASLPSDIILTNCHHSSYPDITHPWPNITVKLIFLFCHNKWLDYI